MKQQRNRCGSAHGVGKSTSTWRRLHLCSVTMLLGRCTCGSSREEKGLGQKIGQKTGPSKEGSEARPGQKSRQAGSSSEGREAVDQEGCQEAGSSEEGCEADHKAAFDEEARACQEGRQAALSGQEGRQAALSGQEGRQADHEAGHEAYDGQEGREASCRQASCGCQERRGEGSSPRPQGGASALVAAFRSKHARPGAFGPPALRPTYCVVASSSTSAGQSTS